MIGQLKIAPNIFNINWSKVEVYILHTPIDKDKKEKSPLNNNDEVADH